MKPIFGEQPSPAALARERQIQRVAKGIRASLYGEPRRCACGAMPWQDGHTWACAPKNLWPEELQKLGPHDVLVLAWRRVHGEH